MDRDTLHSVRAPDVSPDVPGVGGRLEAHPERGDLLLSLCGGLLQLRLGLGQLALQGVAGRLQAADLGLALLQRQGQLRHLPLDLQLLLLVLQPHLSRGRGQPTRPMYLAYTRQVDKTRGEVGFRWDIDLRAGNRQGSHHAIF